MDSVNDNETVNENDAEGPNEDTSEGLNEGPFKPEKNDEACFDEDDDEEEEEELGEFDNIEERPACGHRCEPYSRDNCERAFGWEWDGQLEGSDRFSAFNGVFEKLRDVNGLAEKFDSGLSRCGHGTFQSNSRSGSRTARGSRATSSTWTWAPRPPARCLKDRCS